MKTIPTDKLTPTELLCRKFVCNLPTEFTFSQVPVELVFDRVYAHELNSDNHLPIRRTYIDIKTGLKSQWNDRWHALEIYVTCNHWGASYELRTDWMFLCLDSELPWDNTEAYFALVREFYAAETNPQVPS